MRTRADAYERSHEASDRIRQPHYESSPKRQRTSYHNSKYYKQTSTETKPDYSSAGPSSSSSRRPPKPQKEVSSTSSVRIPFEFTKRTTELFLQLPVIAKECNVPQKVAAEEMRKMMDLITKSEW